MNHFFPWISLVKRTTCYIHTAYSQRLASTVLGRPTLDVAAVAAEINKPKFCLSWTVDIIAAGHEQG